MRYFFAEDEYYYTKKGQEHIISKYDDVEKIVVFPTEEKIEKSIDNGLSGHAFLSPYLPTRISRKFEGTQFFNIVHLPNKHGFLTTGQKRDNRSEDDVIEERLGVSIDIRDERMSDYGGAEALHNLVNIMKEKLRHNIPTKGYLLVGVPGTGKSFFAKCVAGELGYMIVTLNLSAFMEKDDPIYELVTFFRFFEENPGKYIIWLDEIEKMFKGPESQQVMGQLLTSINEGNSNSKSSFFLIATANNIEELSKTNPELFRMGRFDLIIFLLNPTEKNAAKIFKLYIEKQKKILIKNIIPHAIYNYAEDTLSNNIQPHSTENRSRQIGKSFFRNRLNNDFSIDNVIELGREKFIKMTTTNSDLKQAIQDLAKSFDFVFDIDTFIRVSMGTYRKKGMPQIDRYVYTPAEIEVIISKSAALYYLGEREDDHNYMELATDNKPLQASMKDGVKKILADSCNFLEV